MAFGAFWFSVMSLLVKLAGTRLPSMEVVLFRGVITLGLSWLIATRAGIRPVLGTHRRLLILRGALGSIALSSFYFSLTHLPLGEATLIQYMNPVFATLLAAVFVGERIGKGEILCLAASLIGVLLIARPQAIFGAHSQSLDPRHVAIALLGAFCSGAAYAAIRRIGPREPEAVVVLYLPLLTVPLALPFAASGWVLPRGAEWFLLLGVGLTTQIAQTYLTRGLQLEKASRATTVGYLQIVFAGIWGALLLGERPDAWTIVGAVVIIGSTLALAWSRSTVGPGDE